MSENLQSFSKPFSYIKEPYLPSGKTAVCAVSEECGEVIEFLVGMGIEVLKVKPSRFLPQNIASHADLQILPLGGNAIAVNSEQKEIITKLNDLGFIITETDGFTDRYPNDCLLNLLIIKDSIYGNPRCLSDQLTGERKAVSVKQGYAKCSTLLIDSGHAVTDDSGISRALTKDGIENICITQKEIQLPGYERGFIGGASGRISSEEIIFCGKISKTKFWPQISPMFENFRVTEIGNQTPKDFGGIVPLMEIK